jgi:hypothetical protein
MNMNVAGPVLKLIFEVLLIKKLFPIKRNKFYFEEGRKINKLNASMPCGTFL